MPSLITKLNIWQEARAVEPTILPLPAQPKQEDYNQAPQETWFQLLQYPVIASPEEEI